MELLNSARWSGDNGTRTGRSAKANPGSASPRVIHEKRCCITITRVNASSIVTTTRTGLPFNVLGEKRQALAAVRAASSKPVSATSEWM
jgi:hypothetical protein